jgi:hypothetical protein
MKCPLCGCERFYVKDPDDEYETYEFICQDGEVVFDDENDDNDVPSINDSTETYCDKCAWHGKFETLE